MTTKQHDKTLVTADVVAEARRKARVAALAKAHAVNEATNKAKRIVERRKAEAWSEWCRRDAKLAAALREAREYYGSNSQEAVEAYYEYAGNRMPEIPTDEALKEVRAA